jgi:Mn-dependent DtxR family transcriptional regulator
MVTKVIKIREETAKRIDKMFSKITHLDSLKDIPWNTKISKLLDEVEKK